MAKIGIDFGTTNSLLVSYDKQKNRFEYYNYSGDRPVPTSSTVWYYDDNVIVGDEARKNIFDYSGVEGHHFERSIKSKLGTSESAFVFGKEVPSYEVAGEIINHLKAKTINSKAESLDIDLNQAVFTIPINFSGKARKNLRKAANKAGIEVTTFIHEPFAAIIGYYFSRKPGSSIQDIKSNISKLEGKNILTFDWGGGTLDITVVSVKKNRMIEIGTAELTNLAGDEIDKRIANYAWNQFVNSCNNKYSEEYLERVKNKNWGRLISRAETCKIELSSSNNVEFNLYNIIDKQSIEIVISRNDLQCIIYDIIDAAFLKIDEALSNAHITKSNVKVILTGGTCNIPAIQKRMFEEFGTNVENVNNAELVIAQGAAVIAEMGWMPFLSKDIMISLSDGSYWPIFESNTLISTNEVATAYEEFVCVDQRQKIAKIIICEGKSDKERYKQRKDRILQVIKVPILSDYRFGDIIVVDAKIDKNIIMQINAYSKMVCGYDKEHNYSIGKKAEVYQLCFGLDFGG